MPDRLDGLVVRGNAIEGFGHLARTFRSLDRKTVEPVVRAALHDPSEWVRAKAGDTAEDIEQFPSWVARPAVCRPTVSRP